MDRGDGRVKALFWRFADRWLLTLRSRLEHLERMQPSSAREQQSRAVAQVGDGTRLFDVARLVNEYDRSHLQIGERCHVMGEILLLRPEARFRMGNFCSVGADTRIWVQSGVTIGNYVLIAHRVDIIDNNSHSLHWRDRREDAHDVFERGRKLDSSKVSSAEIVIEDDVWVGARSTILKGVRLGRGSVVAASSVVTHSVEPFTLVAGNPARVIRRLEEE
jgi:acetyltransferase-like isoleucine patch superfamily enzyme